MKVMQPKLMKLRKELWETKIIIKKLEEAITNWSYNLSNFSQMVKRWKNNSNNSEISKSKINKLKILLTKVLEKDDSERKNKYVEAKVLSFQ